MNAYNDIFYVASLIEYVGRKTKNRLKDIATAIGVDGLTLLYEQASENHCLSVDYVTEEVTDAYRIKNGEFDSVTGCKYKVPSHRDIGKVYARLVEDSAEDTKNYPKELYQILTSDMSDAISNFDGAFYFAPRSEIAYHYRLLK